MRELTSEQKREISFLVREHHCSAAEALLTVLSPKTKVRAPTMDEIEKLSASQIKELMKC